MNILNGIKVLHVPTNTVYNVMVIVYDTQIVKVKKLDINRNGEQVDAVLAHLPFDECEILLPSGRIDDKLREIIRGDLVVYDGDHRGEVYYDDYLAMWMILDRENDTVKPLNNFDSKDIHKAGSKYGGVNGTNS